MAAQPSPDYLELVRRYAAGEGAEATIAVGRWTEKDLRRELGALRALGPAAQACGSCAARLELDRLPLRAGVMLHTDRQAFERLPLPASLSPDCHAGVHAEAAEQWALLLLEQPDGQGFVRRWYLAQALENQWNPASPRRWVGPRPA